MCGRFTLTSPVDQIASLFGVDELPEEVHARYNIAPTQPVLALRRGEGGEGAREAVMLRWGLVPFWAKDRKIGNRLINARSETVHEKNAFKGAFAKRRCLIAADGFYEWRKEEGPSKKGKKQPYRIRRADGAPFAFAGLWERWSPKGAEGGEGGEVVESCTILTTAPNALVAPLHDRMPVILAQEEFELWLDAQAGREELRPLMDPFPGDEMEAYPVSTQVNSPGNEEPGCIAPL